MIPSVVARRPRSAQVASATWRDGVHLTGTPIWCDARRRRDVCFVSSADRIGRAGHGQLIGTPATLALLEGGAGQLAVPVRKPFTLGVLRLELIPSGRGVGAAALHVDLGGRSVLYAGTVRTAGTAEPAEVRSCDALVIAAPIGQPHHVLPPIDEAAARVVMWAREQLAGDRRPLVVVDTLLDGLEVAERLAAAALPIAASRTLRDAAARLPGAAHLAAPGREPCVVVRVETDRVRALELAGKPPVTALVSLRALEPPTDGGVAFAWPFAADRTQLLAWIEQSGAREVFVTGADAEAIVGALGPRARVLGPPHQMMLFEAANK
jgi:putative mRNA 3-end processing factor